MSQRWQLLNPEGVVRAKKNTINRHPSSLAGKSVLLYWDGKPNGDILLDQTGIKLTENVENVRVIRVWQIDPSTVNCDSNQPASKANAAKLAGYKPDLVIGAPGDCSGSTNWLVTDQLNIEKQGIPTVSIVSAPFMSLARTLPTNEDYNEICLVEVPPPLGMLKEAEVRQKANDLFPAILKAATVWQPSAVTREDVKSYPSTVFEFEGTVDDINRLFFEKKWSPGLPVMPPTPERVNLILQGTCRQPDEIIGYLPPRMGILTVELIAINAVMAGCNPRYMPILITAIEALLTPEANWKMALTGTGTSQTLVIVSGPAVEEIGIGHEQGAAGKGFHANASIGYAINLIAYNVGGSRPPSMDRSTLASPADYVCWVFGENTSALPRDWKSFHKERGFKNFESAVTVMASYPPVENIDHWSTSPEEHIRWWSHIASPLLNMGGVPLPQVMDQNPLIALGPEHASLIATAGWTKADYCKAFWEATAVPASAWPAGCSREKLIEKIGLVSDSDMIHMTIKPAQLLTIVAGGDGKQSHFFSPCIGCFPVSRAIRKYTNQSVFRKTG